MKSIRALTSIVGACLLFSAGMAAQQPSADETAATTVQAASASVPRLIRYSGTLTDPSGKPLSGPLEVDFAIYQDQADSIPIWQETQSLQLDAQGRYSVLLGATQPDGLPVELFSSSMGRWLGIEAPGAAPQPHVLLVAVPYALKAADADTVGGKPASAFMLSQSPGEGSTAQASAANLSVTSSPTAKASSKADDTPSTTVGGTGTINFIPMWTSGTTLGNSLLFQIGGNVGVGTLGLPGARLDAGGTGISIRGTSSGVNGTGVLGNATSNIGLSFGVSGETSSTSNNAAGVFGHAGATAGQVYGVSGNTSSTGPFAAAVNGWEGATTGQVWGVSGGTSSTTNGAAGVSGNANATTGAVSGVTGYAISTTQNASGVSGYEGATTGIVFGVSGGANSTTNGAAAVNGYEGAAMGVVFGVSGATSSATNGAAGVNGNASAPTGQVYGVTGYTNSTGPYAAAVNGYEGAATGQVWGVNGGTNSTTNGAAGVNGGEGAATGVVYGVSGGSSSTTANAAGVNGWEGAATGAVFGVNGNTNSTGPGAAAVNGYEGATTGAVYGVSGTTSSGGGGASGIFGNASATATTGYTSGVYGQCASTSGCNGVNGNDTATSGIGNGVSGTTASSTAGASGVYGIATALTGTTFGVLGTSVSPNGVGVQGGSPNVAVAGFNQTCTGTGCTLVTGTAGQFVTATGGTLLQGLSGSSLTSLTQVFSVDGSGDGTFAGNLNVTGKLTKGSGSFKIDHPLDPANKYLSHSFVESPDMMNIYNGNVVTDEKGEAQVVLPDYFEALNRDFRYQLTVIGQFAQAIVGTKIKNRRFTIRTDKPGVEVSWQVTGIRQDAYANANRIPVEEVKPPAEQGYYLHPELYGQPDSRRVGSGQSASHTQKSGSPDYWAAEIQTAGAPGR